MKKLVAIAGLLALYASSAFAQTYVNPYTRRDGTHVQGHYRSEADGNPYNNWSTRGNTNPYTGERGYTTPQLDNSYPLYTPPSSYGSGYGTKRCLGWSC